MSLIFILWIVVFYVSGSFFYWLAQGFGIDQYASGEPGTSLNKYDYIVAFCFLLNFIGTYYITVISIGFYKGWAIKQTLDYLVHFKNIPKHWLKP
jgi:hypothetical protein